MERRPGLYRLDGNGELSDHALDLEGDDEWLDTFTVTDDGLAFVGRTNRGPLLLRTEDDGSVVSRVLLEDVRTPYRFSGIQQAPDGRLFVAGTDYTTVFVVPWPE